MTGEFSGSKDQASLTATLAAEPVNDQRTRNSDIVRVVAMPDGSEDVPPNQPTHDSLAAPADRDPDLDAASAPTQPGHIDARSARESDIAAPTDRDPDLDAASAPTQPGHVDARSARESDIVAPVTPSQLGHINAPIAQESGTAAVRRESGTATAFALSAPTQPGHVDAPAAWEASTAGAAAAALGVASPPTQPGHIDAPAALEATHTSQPAGPVAQDPTRTSQPHHPAARPPNPPTPRPTPATSPGTPPQASVPQPRNPARYHVLGEHGRGGLGKVSRAHDLELGRDVAIKELLSRSAMHEVRFMREALITARLEHPGIVPVHEAGRWPDGTPFYAMKLVAGRPLRDLLAERKTVDERLALLHHVIAVADAIAYAHGRNIIHRDLKPSNVIVGDFGETVVIDWGLAKDLSSSEESTTGGSPLPISRDDELTSAGTVLGTPAYMAPEQRRGEPVDQRADVYAIGAMLWELCSLEKLSPVDSGNRRRILRRGGIDPDLIAIIDNALDADPDRRYPHAGSLAADLKAFKAGTRIAARRYSPWGMLTHWTRRHRALAVSVATVFAMVLSGTIIYVHNVTAARRQADESLAIAMQERDRALLAQASLLTEKDPTSAQKLLESLTQRSPQYSLLLSRARRLAAVHDIRLQGNITGLHLDGFDVPSVAAVINNGDLISVDILQGTFRALDHHLPGPVASSNRGRGWIYARKSPQTKRVTVLDTTAPTQTIDAGSLLADVTGQLLVANSQTFALENGKLYELTPKGIFLIREDVRYLKGNEHLLVLCTTAGVLEVVRDAHEELRSRCASKRSEAPIAVAGRDYAALLDTSTLLLVRNGTSREFPVHISDEYSLALSATGLLALTGHDGKAWFMRPGREQLEQAPFRASRPTSITAATHYAAWGYADGSIDVIDTDNDTHWEFRGFGSLATRIAIDAAHSLLVSTSGPNLRVWRLAPDPLTKIADLPCNAFNMVESPDHKHAALDCGDGGLRVWTLSTGELRQLHRHRNTAFGIAWTSNKTVCSGGFDGRVLCSDIAGATREILSQSESIRWIVTSPDHRHLVIATMEGTIWDFDGTLRSLYTHNARPYRIAFTSDSQLLASGDADGYVFVYDYSQSRVVTQISAHQALVTNIVWRNRELWTASHDGTIRQWMFDRSGLHPHEVTSEGSFRHFHLLREGWAANASGNFLLIAYGQQGVMRFDMNRYVLRVETSPDERYVAATMDGETIVVDLERLSLSSLRIPSDGIGYVGFTTKGDLAVSNGRALLTVPIHNLDYIPFQNIGDIKS